MHKASFYWATSTCNIQIIIYFNGELRIFLFYINSFSCSFLGLRRHWQGMCHITVNYSFYYSEACSVLRNWTALVNQCGLNPPKKRHCMFTISAFTFYILSSLLWSITWQCVQTRVGSERNENYIPQKKFAEVFLIGKTHFFKQYFCEILSEPIVTSYFWWI